MLHDARNTLVHRQQHLQSVTHVTVGRAGVRAQGRHAVKRAQKRGLAQNLRAGIRPPRHFGSGVAAAMTRSWHESFGLASDRASTAVVALRYVRVQRLVREEHHERPVA